MGYVLNLQYIVKLKFKSTLCFYLVVPLKLMSLHELCVFSQRGLWSERRDLSSPYMLSFLHQCLNHCRLSHFVNVKQFRFVRVFSVFKYSAKYFHSYSQNLHSMCDLRNEKHSLSFSM